MKFARYLEETQTPEWKKAYIDYRGLKKRITAIRRAREASKSRGGSTPLLPLEPQTSNSTVNDPTDDHAISRHGIAMASSSILTYSPSPDPSAPDLPYVAHPHGDDTLDLAKHTSNQNGNVDNITDDSKTRPSSPPHSTTVEMTAVPSLRRRSTAFSGIIGRAHSIPYAASGIAPHAASTHDSNENRRFTWDLNTVIPLMELMPILSPVQRAFFEKLDAELDKVESFFCEREREMRERSNLLKVQLQELQDHRRAFYEAHPIASAGPSWMPVPLPFPTLPSLRWRSAKKNEASPPRNGQANHRQTRSLATVGEPKVRILEAASITEPEIEGMNGEATGCSRHTEDTTLQKEVDEIERVERTRPRSAGAGLGRHLRGVLLSPSQTHSDLKGKGTQSALKHSIQSERAGTALKFDPDEYQHAKKQLKKAVLECYRGLEVLNNYRTLNLIGFRKALKKFEKVTNMPAQQAYTREKIEPSAFASGKSVDAMVREMEELFAARFARGDKKRAMARLRGGFHHKGHHFSTFRTGLTLGLAVPALVGGIYQSFQQDTRRAIPSWDGLLFVYAIFLIPTLFSLLVGINLLVWSRSRINYIFIFELDLRTRLDHRVYFETPAFLLSLLCYAFWLSFSRIGSSNVAPTTWPLLWLAFTALVLLDPLPILFRPSRWWLVKNVGKLLTSGMHRVEFTDFWMGDQFCSLVFTLSNLYFVACAYSHGMDQTWRRCTNGPKWGIPFVLASLPLLVRLVQSVKRWVDSRLITHLINGGKYGSGILMYLFYFMWREHGGGRGSHFVVWCIFATNYSLYAASWDFLMDWSVLRPHATYPLLRSELLYTNCIPLYYVAIITNILIRFIWVLYIPQRGPDFVLRTFIAGMLEMFRRWQWNFFRLENEHLGNVDQYRVTREVPLPYSFDDPSHDSDGDDDDEDKRSRVSISSVSWRRAQKPHGRGSGVIRENIDLN